MKYVLDDLDRKIVLHLSRGVPSYSELAKTCGVSRNTIYRRIDRLESENLIDKTIRALPNFTEFNLSAICIMMEISQSEVQKVISFLARQQQVKLLWRTFGAYNIATVIICRKGEEGDCISKLREVLEKMRVKPSRFEAGISYTWEKMDFSPF